MSDYGQYVGPGYQNLRPQWERDLPEYEREALDRRRGQDTHFKAHAMTNGTARDRTLVRIEDKLDQILRLLSAPPIDQR